MWIEWIAISKFLICHPTSCGMCLKQFDLNGQLWLWDSRLIVTITPKLVFEQWKLLFYQGMSSSCTTFGGLQYVGRKKRKRLWSSKLDGSNKLWHQREEISPSLFRCLFNCQAGTSNPMIYKLTPTWYWSSKVFLLLYPLLLLMVTLSAQLLSRKSRNFSLHSYIQLESNL